MPVSVNQKRDLDMLKHPERWPHWPFLPMVKGRGSFSERVCGLVADTAPISEKKPVPKPVVYLVNLFDLSNTNLSKAEKIEYPTLEAMLADGWWVD